MTDDDSKRVIVVGGGASGLMAAGVAGGRGLQVTVLERNTKVGRKLRIAGKGRCNLTNDTDVEGLLKHVVGNPKFLRSAFYGFTAQQTIAFFHRLGLITKTERGGRVFPVSDDADDVVQALLRYCRKGGVQFHNGVAVKRIITGGGRVSGVLTEEKPILADAVIDPRAKPCIGVLLREGKDLLKFIDGKENAAWLFFQEPEHRFNLSGCFRRFDIQCQLGCPCKAVECKGRTQRFDEIPDFFS